jgi:hypothetical protein
MANFFAAAAAMCIPVGAYPPQLSAAQSSTSAVASSALLSPTKSQPESGRSNIVDRWLALMRQATPASDAGVHWWNSKSTFSSILANDPSGDKENVSKNVDKNVRAQRSKSSGNGKQTLFNIDVKPSVAEKSDPVTVCILIVESFFIFSSHL